jgi:putative flippase GtrA
MALPLSVRQFVAYILIGGVTTSLNFLAFEAAVLLLDLRSGRAPLVASVIAYVATSVLAYFLNSRIAFRAQHAGDSASVLLRFATTFGSSAALSALVFSAVRRAAGSDALGLTLAEVVSIGAAIAWNFTLLRAWVFPARDAQVASHG